MLNIQMLELTKLKPYERNIKSHPKEQIEKIARQISEHGFDVPIVVDPAMVIIKGHGRLLAAKKLKLKTVPVIIRTDLSPEQVKAARIADNKVAESEWEMDFLKDEMKWLKDLDYDLTLTGFDEFDFLGADAPDPGCDEDDVPPVVEDKIAVTQRGNIYQLGNHRLMCGDSTSGIDVAELMNGKKADMVFTDPPYGVDYEGGHNKKKRQGIKNDALEGQDLTDLFGYALSHAVHHTHSHAAFYIWYANGKAVETFASFAKLSLSVRAVICWYKVKSGLGAFMSQYIPNYEPCIYAFKTGCSPQWFGPSDEKTVWELKKESRNDFHPTQKPVELSERAIKNSSVLGNIILDVFGGSGSTMIACEKNNRNCYMMEMDPKYCDVIVSRWETFTGKKATLIEPK